MSAITGGWGCNSRLRMRHLRQIDARHEFQRSLAAYKACLAAHSADTQSCQGARLAMEADERAYDSLTAGTQLGGHKVLISR